MDPPQCSAMGSGKCRVGRLDEAPVVLEEMGSERTCCCWSRRNIRGKMCRNTSINYDAIYTCRPNYHTKLYVIAVRRTYYEGYDAFMSPKTPMHHIMYTRYYVIFYHFLNHLSIL
jgi:hypothetical protein